ncbi:MAG: hypothetical protein RR904_04975 [Bacilli bacterium]
MKKILHFDLKSWKENKNKSKLLIESINNSIEICIEDSVQKTTITSFDFIKEHIKETKSAKIKYQITATKDFKKEEYHFINLKLLDSHCTKLVLHENINSSKLWKTTNLVEKIPNEPIYLKSFEIKHSNKNNSNKNQLTFNFFISNNEELF